jgi:hypothetical protein
VRKLLGRLAGSSLGQKRSGFRLARLLPKPLASCPSRILPEMTLEISSRVFLGLPPLGGESSCNLKLASATSSMKSTSLFVFPPLPIPKLPPPVTLIAHLAPTRLFVSSGFSGSSCGTETPAFAPPPLLRAFKLGEKIHSSIPVLINPKPFRYYYQRARALRAGHSVKWNDGLLSDSLEASKTTDGFVIENTIVELPLKKVAELPVKDLLRKGFLNSRQSNSSREVGNGFSQTQASPVVFYHNGEIDVWEKATEFWERLTVEWEMYGGHDEEFMAIVDEMIKRQKSKGKRELLNLQSFVNYGDFKDSSRCRKGKAQMM